MKPSELIASLRACGPQTLSVTLHYVADRYKDLTLENGRYPHEVGEHQLVLRQLALAAQEAPFVESTAVWCGVDLGKGGQCDCKAEVRASRRIRRRRRLRESAATQKARKPATTRAIRPATKPPTTGG